MALLARRNLFHDRIRFAVTLTGIVFALVLIIIQFGLFLGFTTTTSNNIDHSHADLWVVFHGVGYFDTGRMFSERKFYEVLSTPSVQQAEKYMQNFAYWKKPDGGVENVQVIGFRPGSGLGEPWNEDRHALSRRPHVHHGCACLYQQSHTTRSRHGFQRLEVLTVNLPPSAEIVIRARALAGDPPILLADEPTAALDSSSGRTVIELLQRLAHRHTRAVVMVTHDPRVLSYGDRILHLEDGILAREESARPAPAFAPQMQTAQAISSFSERSFPEF